MPLKPLDARTIVRSHYKEASPTRRIVRYGKLTKHLAYEITQDLLNGGVVSVLFVSYDPHGKLFIPNQQLDLYNKSINHAEKYIKTLKLILKADRENIIRSEKGVS